MLRTTVGWSLTFVLVLGGGVACSSTSKDEGTGAGGNGSIVGAGGTSGSGAGTAGRAGASSGACVDPTITCVDATTARGCNSATGVVDTFSCVDELAVLGIVSAGCATDATGDFCSIDDFADQACADGTGAFAYCENATTDEEVFNVYVNCYQDYMMGHTVIPCFAQYVTPTMRTAGNCQMAEDACFGGIVAGGSSSGGSGGTGTGGGSSGGTGGTGGVTAAGGDPGAGGAP